MELMQNFLTLRLQQSSNSNKWEVFMKKSIFKHHFENVIMAEPFTIRGSEALGNLSDAFPNATKMTIETFFKELYVEPFEISPLNEEDKIRSSNLEKIFRENLKGLGSTIFRVVGPPGSGKTTYVKSLERDIGSEDKHEVVYCDLERAYQWPKLSEGVSHDFGSDIKKSTLRRFASVLLVQVFNLLKCRDDEDLQEYLDRIRSYAEMHREYFLSAKQEQDEIPDLKDFFNILAQFRLEVCDSPKKAQESVIYFFNAIANRDSTYKTFIEITYGILNRLIFCLNVLDKNRCKYIYVFDNIESYLDFEVTTRDMFYDQEMKGKRVALSEIHRVFTVLEHEVTMIEKIILDAIADRDNRLQIIKNEAKDFETSFGIVFVSRKATNVLYCSSAQNADEAHKQTLDITNWYCYEKIYNERYRYFSNELGNPSEYVNPDADPFWLAFKNSMGDRTEARWSIYKLVNDMYNGSMRRIARALQLGITQVGETQIEYFNKQWEKAFSNNKADDSDFFKNICRSYIFSLLLKTTRKGSAFGDFSEYLKINHRCVSENNFNDTVNYSHKNTYARKIVTLLARKSMSSSKPENSFMSFPEIVEALLKKPSASTALNPAISENRVKTLALLLYRMCEQRWKVNHWGNFIELNQVGLRNLLNDDYDEGRFVDKLLISWQAYNSNDYKDIGFRISDSGDAFVWLAPTFEYFAQRYAYHYQPLFSKDNFLRDEDGQVFKCISIIREVRKQAEICIRKNIDFDSDFFEGRFNTMYKGYYLYKSRFYASHPETHAARILRFHTQYLKRFLEYVENCTKDDVGIRSFESEKVAMILGIRQELIEYLHLAKSIILANESYFGRFGKKNLDNYTQELEKQKEISVQKI
jgi:hypothetical protein